MGIDKIYVTAVNTPHPEKKKNRTKTIENTKKIIKGENATN